MRLLLLILALLCPPAFGQILGPILFGGAPVSTSYSAFKTITIDHTKVPSTQTSFPMVFTGTFAYLADVGHSGSVTNASGYDIIFSSTNNLDGSGKIAFDRVAWNNTTGAVTFEVLIASLSSSVDTVIYLLYGNASVTTDQANPHGVYDVNFLQVNHLSEATGAALADSTSNGNGSTSNSGNVSVTGQWGTATNFPSASSASAVFPNAFPAQPGLFTVSGWIKEPNATNYGALYEARNAIATTGMLAYAIITSGVFSHTMPGIATANCAAVSDNNWHYVVANFSLGSSQMSCIVDNNAPVNSSAIIGSGAWSPGHLGVISNNTTYSTFTNNAVQELRISNVRRSTNWSTTEYNNQKSPGTFYTVT